MSEPNLPHAVFTAVASLDQAIHSYLSVYVSDGVLPAHLLKAAAIGCHLAMNKELELWLERPTDEQPGRRSAGEG